MELPEEIKFLHSAGLRVTFFGKDLRDFRRGISDCTVFVVATRREGDELYQPRNRSKRQIKKLRTLIRCGDPKGKNPEWTTITSSKAIFKFYLAGQDCGVDCSSVMDDMFANEEGKKFTYSYKDGDKDVEKIAHPHDSLVLSEHFAKPWSAATKFSHLCALNRKFLLGKLPQTPYHLGPIDDETIPLVQGLLELHNFGLLTFQSQPYDHDSYFEVGAGWVEYQQRPFVDFFMSGNDGQYLKLFKALQKDAEIMVRVSQIYPYAILEGSDQDVNVSRQRIAKRAKQLGKKPWINITSALCSLDLTGDDIFALDALKNSCAVEFSVAAKAWDDSRDLDLLALIKEVATKCGLPRIS